MEATMTTDASRVVGRRKAAAIADILPLHSVCDEATENVHLMVSLWWIPEVLLQQRPR
jgi:hypothetical protein